MKPPPTKNQTSRKHKKQLKQKSKEMKRTVSKNKMAIINRQIKTQNVSNSLKNSINKTSKSKKPITYTESRKNMQKSKRSNTIKGKQFKTLNLKDSQNKDGYAYKFFKTQTQKSKRDTSRDVKRILSKSNSKANIKGSKKRMNKSSSISKKIGVFALKETKK